MEPVELPTLLEAYVRDGLNHVHKAMPAIVDAYDATTQTCTVHVAVKQPLPDGTYQEFPALSGIKVGHLRGGGFIVATPLVKGDAVLLIFLDQSPAEWHQTGAVGEPKDTRRHGLYCYALPVAFPDSAKAVSASGTKLVIGRDGQDQRIEIDAAFISLGPGATDFAAMASKVDTAISNLVTWANTHVHTGVTTGPGSSGTPGTPIAGQASVASGLVKLK